MARKQRSRRGQAAKTSTKWKMQRLPEVMSERHGLPASLPVPRKEAERVERGRARYHELARWIHGYLAEHPETPQIDAYTAAAGRLEELHQAMLLLDEGSHKAAISRFQSILSKAPADDIARVNLVQCFLRMNQFEEAYGESKKVTIDLTNDPQIAVINARVLTAVDKKDEAIKLLNQTRQKHRGALVLLQELVRLGDLVPVENDARNLGKTRFISRTEFLDAVPREAKKALDENDEDKARRIARYHLDARMPDVAQAVAEVILGSNSEDAEALLLLGTAVSRQGNYEEAEKKLRTLLEREPSNQEAKLELAYCLNFLGKDQEEIRKLLVDILDEDPNKIRAAELYVLLSKEEDAQLMAIKTLREQYPDAWLPMKLQGDLDVRLGMFDQALKNHRAAFEASDSDEAATMILHDLAQMDRYSEALTFIDKIGETLGRRSISVRWNCALLLVRLGKKRKAAMLLESIVRDRKLAPESRFSANVLLHQVLPKS